MATSEKYIFMLPCNENSGDALDVSGNGYDAIEESGNSDGMWINPGYITSMYNVALGGVEIPLLTTTIPFDPWQGHSYIYMAVLNADIETSADIWSGNNRLNADDGIDFRQQEDGRIGTTMRRGSDNSERPNALSRYVGADGTDHHIAWVFDGPTRTMSIYIDGELGDAASGGLLVNGGGVGIHFTSCLTGSVQADQAWSWGSAGGRNNAAQNFASSWYGIHYLEYQNQSLPANVYDIVQAAMATPRTPLDSSIAG